MRSRTVAYIAATAIALIVVSALPAVSGCQPQTRPQNIMLVVEVPQSLLAAPERAALLVFEEVQLAAGEGVFVQIFAVPPTGHADTELSSEDYLGYFAGEARTAESGPPRNFVVAAPTKLPALVKRAATTPLRVVLVPVDRGGRPTKATLKVGRVRAAAD